MIREALEEAKLGIDSAQKQGAAAEASVDLRLPKSWKANEVGIHSDIRRPLLALALDARWHKPLPPKERSCFSEA